MQGDTYKYCPVCSSSLSKQLIDGKTRPSCGSCGFVYWNNPAPTTSVILEKAGKVLMLKRSFEPFKNYWVLPGGYIEYDESPQSANVRETKEETGLDIALTGVADIYLIDTDPRGNSIDMVFSGRITGGKLTFQEHSQHRFFHPDKLPRLIAYQHRRVISEWYRKNHD